MAPRHRRRHLARRFARTLGLGPKAFARIVRFQGALRRARAGKTWAVVAARAGYSDQAHLAKECLALSGCTPAELLGEVEQRAVGRYFNDADPALRRSTLYL
jgi:AraC-like DNA-binding protein